MRANAWAICATCSQTLWEQMNQHDMGPADKTGAGAAWHPGKSPPGSGLVVPAQIDRWLTRLDNSAALSRRSL